MDALPPRRITFSETHAPRCAVCNREWGPEAGGVPTVFTLATVDSPRPEPICDLCIKEHDPAMFADLLVDRRRFWES